MTQSVLHSNYSTIFSSATSRLTSTSTNATATNSEKAIATRTTTTKTTTTDARSLTTREATTTLRRRTFITTGAAAAAALKTTNLVGHPFQNDNQWIAVEDKTTSGEDNVEPENEMGLLWLPYVIFTIVLLGLIAMSFVRFHCQRGDQYRRRRSELEDKVSAPGGGCGVGVGGGDRSPMPPAAGTGAAPSSSSSSYQPNGGSSVVPGKPVRCGGDVPEHMVLFLQFTETETPPPENGCASQDDQWTGTKRPGSTRRVFGFKAQSKVPSVDATLNAAGGSDGASSDKGGDSGGCGGGKQKQQQQQQQRVTCHRRPLTFTFNINGSMVDIRCSDEERTKTFQLSTRAEAEHEAGTGNAATATAAVMATAPEMVDASAGDRSRLWAAAGVMGDYEDDRRCPWNNRDALRAAAATATKTLSSSSRRSSSNKTQGQTTRGGGGGGEGGGGGGAGAGGAVGGGTGGAAVWPHQKVLMYSMTSAAGTCELRQNSASGAAAADESLFLLHPMSRS